MASNRGSRLHFDLENPPSLLRSAGQPFPSVQPRGSARSYGSVPCDAAPGIRGQPPPLAWDESCTEDQGKGEKKKKAIQINGLIVCSHEGLRPNTGYVQNNPINGNKNQTLRTGTGTEQCPHVVVPISSSETSRKRPTCSFKPSTAATRTHPPSGTTPPSFSRHRVITHPPSFNSQTMATSNPKRWQHLPTHAENNKNKKNPP